MAMSSAQAVAACPPAGGRPPAKGFLWPREHGATVQAIVPAVTGLLAGTATPAAGLLTAGLWLAFLAHEPLLVLVGQRGQGARRRQTQAARRQLAWLVPGALASGAAGLWLAPPAARYAALPALGVAALHGAWLARGGTLRAAGTEVFAAVGLSVAALPILLAAQLTLPLAGLHVLVWSVGFGLLTAAVHASKARMAAMVAARPSGLWPQALAVLAALVALGAAAGLAAPAGGALAVLAVTAAVTASVAVQPRQIRRLGIGFALASAVAAVWLAVG